MRIYKRIDTVKNFRKQHFGLSSTAPTLFQSVEILFSTPILVLSIHIYFLGASAFQKNYGVAEVAPSDRPIQDQRDRKGQGGRGRDFLLVAESPKSTRTWIQGFLVRS